jgi:DNA-binding NarL/FixJ family response regulator
MSTTVVLADDHEIIRKVIVRLLRADPDIQIVAEVSSFAQTLDLVSEVHPHVVVLDLHMKDEESMTPKQLKSGLEGSRLLAMSIWNDNETKALAKAIGAEVLLDKTKLAAELIPTIRNCANNRNVELILNS